MTFKTGSVIEQRGLWVRTYGSLFYNFTQISIIKLHVCSTQNFLCKTLGYHFNVFFKILIYFQRMKNRQQILRI